MAWKTRRDASNENDPPHLPGARPIERVGPTGRASFQEQYVRPNRPVVIAGAMEGWRARGWTLDYLAAAAGDKTGEVIVSATGLFPDYETRPEPMAKLAITLRELVERASGAPSRAPVVAPGEACYLYGKEWLFEAAPWLLDDLATPAFLGGMRLGATVCWMSGRGSVTPLHYDLENNVLAQVIGEKHVVVFAPADHDRLYFRTPTFPGMTNFDRQSRVDIHHPDAARFPAFAGATAYEHVLRPGEMLFLPSNWPHEVETLSTSVSIGFQCAGGTATSEFAVLADRVKRATAAGQRGTLEQALREDPTLMDDLLRSPLAAALGEILRGKGAS